MAANKSKEQLFTVVGLHYRTTKPQIEKWVEQLPIGVRFEREPENIEDRNAIAVWIDDKSVREREMKIGYLPRQVAQVFAMGMDSGYVKLPPGKLHELDPDTGTGTVTVKVRKRIHRG